MAHNYIIQWNCRGLGNNRQDIKLLASKYMFARNCLNPIRYKGLSIIQPVIKVFMDMVVSAFLLTHWGRVTHICVSKLTIIGSDNGLSPGRRQAITWTNAGILLIGPLGTNFNETSIGIHTFWIKKIHLKLSSGKWRPFCLRLNVLKITPPIVKLNVKLICRLLQFV